MLKRIHIAILVMVVVTIIGPAMGQVRKNAFVINDDQMVLYIDLKLSKAAIDSLLRIADIQGIRADRLVNGDFNELKKNGWVIKNLKSGQLVIAKPLEELARNAQTKAFLITQDMLGNNGEGRPGYPGKVLYGVNSFARQTIYDLPSGITRFFLPGNRTSKKVLLSSSFNNWNTSKGIMTKTDSGWVADVRLKPGEYLYKYIVDGHWMADPNNRLQEDDGVGDKNSAYFKYNYTFKLTGFSKAARVTVIGSFNKWNGNELVMQPKNGVWAKSLYLGEGMHSYRFLIDGKETLDPANADKGIDASGKPASVLNIGTPVVFKLKGYPNAKNVYIAGEFNNWKPNDIHLKKSTDSWLLNCILPAGNYGYKFIVDGNWMLDPVNKHKCIGGDQVNSLVAVKPNHTFVLHGYNNAREVHLSGTFNNWNEFGYTLKHEGQDWKISVNLPQGKHLYKFMVDGNWIIDPGNKLWEQNEFGTGNSVLWLE